jgi:Ala-tRNA(Pro) deacylase
MDCGGDASRMRLNWRHVPAYGTQPKGQQTSAFAARENDVDCAGAGGSTRRPEQRVQAALQTGRTVMSAAPELTRYLASRNIGYDTVDHGRTMSSMRTAEECHIPADCLAKAVVLLDDNGYFLAVLPASHHLRFSDLEDQGHWPVRMATEEEIERLFPDCIPGAIPPVGAAYGLRTVVDESITEVPEIYFEGGDHATLVHMSGPAFDRLMAESPRSHFSMHA